MKTSAKYYYLTVWAQVQWAKVAKSHPFMTPLTKKLHPPTKKFERKLQDLPSLLSFLPCLYSLPDQRNSPAKPHAIKLFLREPLELIWLRKC